MNEERLRSIQQALREEHIDAWIFADFKGSDPIAQRLLGLSGKAMVTRRWFYVIPAQGEPTRLCNQIEPHSLDHLPGALVLYGKWQDWQAKLASALKGMKALACQYSPEGVIPALGRLDTGLGEYLRGLGLQLVSSGDLVARFEVTLDREQVDGHFRAMEVLLDTVDMAFARVRSSLNAGEPLTEYALQQAMLDHMKAGGLVTDAAPIVGVDAHAADPHYEPGPEGSSTIRGGQVLLLDLWGKEQTPGSVYADITWCAWTGTSVPDEQGKVFRIVRDARDAGIAKALTAAADKVCGWEVDRATRDVIDGAGYGDFFIHRTGHSIYEEDHANGANMDDYETRDTRRLLQNTLFSIEPGIYLPGRFGFRSEVNVLVRESDVVVTGRRQEELPALLA